MKKANILVFDDSEGSASTWRDSIAKAIGSDDIYLGETHVSVLSVEKFSTSLRELEERRLALREGNIREETKTPIDESDIFVIDFDLIEFWRGRGNGNDYYDMTGEAVAYLARCYSDCGLLIALNQGTPQPIFDLTLRGRPDSFADLNIASSMIGIPNLWKSPSEHEEGASYFPWYWPIIPHETYTFSACTKDIRDRNMTLKDLIGLDESDFGLLPEEAIDFIIGTEDVDPTNISNITIEQIAKRAVKARRPKDILDEKRMTRIGTARIRAWLRWFVLPAQSPISDFPHAISRLPEILSDPTNTQSLNLFCTRDFSKIPNNSFNKSIAIKKYILPKKQQKWWPSPVLRWNRLQDDDSIVSIRMKSEFRPGFVFCEDISMFTQKEKARLFKSNVLSAYQDRYVTTPSRIKIKLPKGIPTPIYLPATRLSM